MRFVLFLVVALFAAIPAAQAAPPLEAYGQLPAIDYVSLSPSGERFALVARTDTGRRLAVMRADGTIELAADIDNLKVENVEWGGDEHLVFFTHETVSIPVDAILQQEWLRATHIDLKTRKAYGVMQKSERFIPAVFGWYGVAKVGGRWKGYLGLISSAQSKLGGTVQPNLFSLDLQTGTVEQVADSAAGSTSWAVDGQGQVLATGAFDARGQSFRLFPGARQRDAVLVRDTRGGRQYRPVGTGSQPGVDAGVRAHGGGRAGPGGHCRRRGRGGGFQGRQRRLADL